MYPEGALRELPPGWGEAAFEPAEEGFVLAGRAQASATVGTLLDPLETGVPGRLDYATKVRVKLRSGALASRAAWPWSTSALRPRYR